MERSEPCLLGIDCLRGDSGIISSTQRCEESSEIVRGNLQVGVEEPDVLAARDRNAYGQYSAFARMKSRHNSDVGKGKLPDEIGGAVSGAVVANDDFIGFLQPTKVGVHGTDGIANEICLVEGGENDGDAQERGSPRRLKVRRIWDA
jgi:hypothetical protein